MKKKKKSINFRDFNTKNFHIFYKIKSQNFFFDFCNINFLLFT